MNCAICKKGNVEPGEVTVTLERGDATLVFKNVPAMVCENCGEEYVDDEVTQKLLEDAEKAVSSGAVVDVRRYQAA